MFNFLTLYAVNSLVIAFMLYGFTLLLTGHTLTFAPCFIGGMVFYMLTVIIHGVARHLYKN